MEQTLRQIGAGRDQGQQTLFLAMQRFAMFLIGTALLSACAAGPDYRPRTAAELDVPDQWSVTAAPDVEDLTAWWRKFDDPILTQLVEEAANTNLDLVQAVARLRQAREALIIDRASLFPALRGSGGYSRTETVRGAGTTISLPDGTVTTTGGGGKNTYSLGLDASYQVDLFGGSRLS